MSICIFGGAFDPIHNGHIQIAHSALNKFNINKLIFMASKMPPHKSSHKADFFHRYNMIKLVTDGYDYFDVTDIENRNDSFSYTYNSLIEIKKIYNNDTIYFLLGDDIFATIESWYRYEELFSLAFFIVGHRHGISSRNMMNHLPENIKFRIANQDNIMFFELDNTIDISSSFIRNNIKKSRDYLPKSVYRYIKTNKLYINEE